MVKRRGTRLREGEHEWEFMKTVSINIRGLGGRVKWKYLKENIRKEEVDMMCI